MKPSASRSERAGSALFAGVLSRGAVAHEVSDAAWLRALVDVEVALGRAVARAGLAPEAAADALLRGAESVELDVAALALGSGLAGNPVPALVEQLARAAPGARDVLHRGATSQDVIDTAMMLVAKRALAVIVADLDAVADAVAALAERHRTTLMTGRTLLQPALPVTFGLKAATWLTALLESRARLVDVASKRLAAQLGGAAGTLASLEDRGADVARLLASELGLVEPLLPWHTSRLPVVELSAALAGVSVVLGKIARDVTLLAQAEVGEVAEAPGETELSAGRGGSSTLPHKRNPVAAVATLAATRRVPGLLSTLVVAAEQEHERGAGGWHAEWETLSDLLRVVGSAAAWTRELSSGLTVDVARARANLDAAGDMLFGEHVVTLLAPGLGRLAAHRLVTRVAGRVVHGASFLEALESDVEAAAALAAAGITRDNVKEALSPEKYLGATQIFVDRALHFHRAEREAIAAAPAALRGK